MDISQTLIGTPRALLIDLDNCPSQLAHLPQAVAHFSRVVVCYGGFDPKIPLNQLNLLAPALVEGRLAIEPMERKGKNAADFGLTFWAGRLLAEMPPETKFLVLSRDSDLDYLVDMLRHAGRKAERLDGNTTSDFGITTSIQDTLSTSVGIVSASSSLEEASENYRTVHLLGRRTRPARRLTLVNSIRSHLKGTGIDAEALLQELIRRGVLTVGRGGLVTYRDRVQSNLLNERLVSDSAVAVSNLTPAPKFVPISASTTNSAVAAVEIIVGDTDTTPASNSSAVIFSPSDISEAPMAREEIIVGFATPVSTVPSLVEASALSTLPLVSAMENVPVSGITGPTDEYYVVHVATQRARPARRVALLNSIRSYFKNQPAVDPEAVMAELFRRGAVSQNRGGQLRYHDRPVTASAPVPTFVSSEKYPQLRSIVPKTIRPSRVLAQDPTTPVIPFPSEQIASVTRTDMENNPSSVLKIEMNTETDIERSEVVEAISAFVGIKVLRSKETIGESIMVPGTVIEPKNSFDHTLMIDAISESDQTLPESSYENVAEFVAAPFSSVPLLAMETPRVVDVMEEVPKSTEITRARPSRVRRSTTSKAQLPLIETIPPKPRPPRMNGGTRSTRKPRTSAAAEPGVEVSGVEKTTATDS